VICENFLGGVEAVLNIGIGGIDNLGCEITSLKKTPNYQYDCTDPKAPKCETNNNNNHFYGTCLGPVTMRENNRNHLSFMDMIKRHKLENKRLALKIDCEGCEYRGLQMVPVEVLDNVDVIIGELHLEKLHNEEWGMLDIVRTLTDRFVVTNIHMSNFGCMPERKLAAYGVEISMVSRRLIKLKSNSRSYDQLPLNKVLNLAVPDCQQPDHKRYLEKPVKKTEKEEEISYPPYKGNVNDLTFSYPTIGIPQPGKKYNSTKVKPEEMDTFDDQFLEMLQPYNVFFLRLRTQTACRSEGETKPELPWEDT